MAEERPGAERIFTPQFVLCFVAHGLQAIAFNLYLPFPKRLNELGANDVVIGAAASLTGLAAVLARPAIGRAMDRAGRRWTILVGGALHVVATALYLGIDRVGPLLAATRLLHGIAEAMLFSALFTFAADYVPARKRTQGLALFGVSGMLPIGIGPTAADWLIANRGWPWVFVTASALAAISLALSLGLRDAPRARIASDAARVTMLEVLGQRELRPIWFLGGAFATVLTAFFVFVPRFAQDTGIGSDAVFFQMYMLAALILRIAFGWVPDRIGPHRALTPALLALVAGLVVMARASAPHDVALAGFLCGLGHGYAFPILSGMVVNRVSDDARGSALAIFTGLFDLGMLIGSSAFGALVEWRGFAVLYAFGAIVLGSALAVFTRWDRRVMGRRR
ncbi:MAG TPA: MFS transporter [Myxococcota bacterium]